MYTVADVLGVEGDAAEWSRPEGEPEPREDLRTGIFRGTQRNSKIRREDVRVRKRYDEGCCVLCVIRGVWRMIGKMQALREVDVQWCRKFGEVPSSNARSKIVVDACTKQTRNFGGG